MANREDIALTAHLMRRAGFGAPRGKIESLAEQGYEETVEQLLHPEDQPEFDEYTLYRYHPMTERPTNNPVWGQVHWLYRMVQTERPLQEKMALFWHHVFATGLVKTQHILSASNQIEMFRKNGMSDMRTMLLDLSMDPAMIFWLDNNENHKSEPNENYGRELLNFFHLGSAITQK